MSELMSESEDRPWHGAGAANPFEALYQHFEARLAEMAAQLFPEPGRGALGFHEPAAAEKPDAE